MSTQHVRILEAFERGPATCLEVAASTGIKFTIVSTWLSRLRTMGILAAEPVEHDKRGRPPLRYRLAA